MINMILNQIEKKKTMKARFSESKTKNILPDFEITRMNKKCSICLKILKSEKRKSSEHKQKKKKFGEQLNSWIKIH